MYHSVNFKNASGIVKNTWDNWRLIPTAKPSFPMPEFQTNYVDIPGRSGSIDMSTYLTGQPVYSDRTGTFDFYAVDTEIDWDVRCAEIGQFLHGQQLTVILEDDPMYYYTGRFTVSGKKTDGNFPVISFNYRVQPYKIHSNTGAKAF